MPCARVRSITEPGVSAASCLLPVMGCVNIKAEEVSQALKIAHGKQPIAEEQRVVGSIALVVPVVR